MRDKIVLDLYYGGGKKVKKMDNYSQTVGSTIQIRRTCHKSTEKRIPRQPEPGWVERRGRWEAPRQAFCTVGDILASLQTF